MNVGINKDSEIITLLTQFCLNSIINTKDENHIFIFEYYKFTSDYFISDYKEFLEENGYQYEITSKNSTVDILKIHLKYN